MSWDDVEITAADVLGEYLPTHPVQLVMAADRVVELPTTDYGYVQCPCAGRTRIIGIGMSPLASPTHTVVRLHLYQINNVPISEVRIWEDGIRMIAVRDVQWCMGLCECGTLYWRPAGDRVRTVMA